MSSVAREAPDVDFIRAPGCVKVVVRLGLDSTPVQTSILKNYDDIVTDDGSSLLLPAGCRDSENIAWVAANKFGCSGMGIGTLAQVIKVIMLLLCVRCLCLG